MSERILRCPGSLVVSLPRGQRAAARTAGPKKLIYCFKKDESLAPDFVFKKSDVVFKDDKTEKVRVKFEGLKV